VWAAEELRVPVYRETGGMHLLGTRTQAVMDRTSARELAATRPSQALTTTR
jgi:hypothetical protein